MPVTHASRIVFLFALVGGLALTSGACSSTPSASPSNADGGSSGSDGGGDATSGGSCGYTGTNAMCLAEAALCGQCASVFPACMKVGLGTCDQAAARLSAGFLQIQAACISNSTCADITSGKFFECGDGATRQLKPTQAHTKLAQDFCAACHGGTAAQCEADFYAQPDGSDVGSGGEFLMYSDDLVGKIDATCIPAGVDGGGGACDATFLQCASGVINASEAPNPCKDSGS
jgi:hypothetical protein